MFKASCNEWKILVRTGIWEEGGREERNPPAGRIWEGFMQEGAVEWEGGQGETVSEAWGWDEGNPRSPTAEITLSVAGVERPLEGQLSQAWP